MTKKRTLDKTAVMVAMVGAIATIVVGYWQFVWKPSHSTLTPIQGAVVYVGRVLDNSTGLPIAGAKVVLDFQGTPPVVYTDSEGVYRFLLRADDDLLVRVKVEMSGYAPYERNVTLLSDNPQIEDIRLNHED